MKCPNCGFDSNLTFPVRPYLVGTFRGSFVLTVLFAARLASISAESACGADLPSFQGCKICGILPTSMFLRAKARNKDGKQHRYFSVVENRRLGRKKTVQRTVLYLGEINDSQAGAERMRLGHNSRPV